MLVNLLAMGSGDSLARVDDLKQPLRNIFFIIADTEHYYLSVYSRYEVEQLYRVYKTTIWGLTYEVNGNIVNFVNHPNAFTVIGKDIQYTGFVVRDLRYRINRVVGFFAFHLGGICLENTSDISFCPRISLDSKHMVITDKVVNDVVNTFSHLRSFSCEGCDAIKLDIIASNLKEINMLANAFSFSNKLEKLRLTIPLQKLTIVQDMVECSPKLKVLDFSGCTDDIKSMEDRDYRNPHGSFRLWHTAPASRCIVMVNKQSRNLSYMLRKHNVGLVYLKHDLVKPTEKDITKFVAKYALMHHLDKTKEGFLIEI